MTVDWITDLRYNILEALYNYGGLTQRRISNKLDSSDDTIHKSIGKLVDLNLVDRNENKVYSLTRNGRKTLDNLDIVYKISSQAVED